VSKLNRSEAFASYGAKLRNTYSSCSAWAPDGSLVVSMWDHHYRKGRSNSAEYVDSLDRWKGPGNTEFRKNIALAVDQKASIRLIVSRSDKPALVQAGGDASKASNEFFVRDEMVGEVAEFDGTNYVLRFHMLATPARHKSR
jgi:hypothetical protein